MISATKMSVPFRMDIWEKELIKDKGGRKWKENHKKLGTKSR